MRTTLQKTVLAGLLAWAGSAAAQNPDMGWYVGIGGGGSDYSDNIPRQIAAAYANNASYTLTSARVTDSSDSAAQVFVGYKFNPWLGVELGYQDLGSARTFYGLQANTSSYVPKPAINGEYGLDDVNLSVVGTWPIYESFALLGRVGVSDTRLSYDEAGTDAFGNAFTFHAKDRSRSSTFAGIGAEWRFAPAFSVRLDLDRNFDVGKKFALNPTGNGRFDNVDAYTLNLIWKP